MYSKRIKYSSALKCTLRLVVYEIDQENNQKKFITRARSLYKEVPMMTNANFYNKWSATSCC